MLSPIQKTIVNDIDLDALQELVDEAGVHPALGFEVITRWDGQFRSESRVGPIRAGNGDLIVRDHVIKADEPEEILGSNEAPNPQELLMAALNACMTVGYVAGASKRGITLTKLEIETKGTLDLRGFFQLADTVPPGYPKLELSSVSPATGLRISSRKSMRRSRRPRPTMTTWPARSAWRRASKSPDRVPRRPSPHPSGGGTPRPSGIHHADAIRHAS